MIMAAKFFLISIVVFYTILGIVFGVLIMKYLKDNKKGGDDGTIDE